MSNGYATDDPLTRDESTWLFRPGGKSTAPSPATESRTAEFIVLVQPVAGAQTAGEPQKMAGPVTQNWSIGQSASCVQGDPQGAGGLQ